MQDSRRHPERCQTLRLRLRTLVWLSLALALLLTSCTAGDSGQGAGQGSGQGAGPGAGDPGGGGAGSDGSPPTNGGPNVAPPTTVESSLARYEALAKRELQPGSIVYNPPQQMRLDERTRIEARVTRHSDKTLTSNLQGKGAPLVEQLPVGTKMRGELLSDDFTITPLRPEVQLLGAEGFRSWVWEIQPSKTGDLTLTLVLSVVYDADMLDFTSFDRNIEVSVTPTYATTSWLSRNWDKVVGVLGVTVVGAVGSMLAFLRRRRTQRPAEAYSKPARPLERHRNSH
jgi:hypothetical protein